MKLVTTLFLLVFAAATATASIEPQDLTVQRDVTSGTLIFRSTIALEQDAAMSLVDNFGNTIYTDSVAKGKFINKRFPAGVFTATSYQLVVSDQAGRTVLPLKVSDKGVAANFEKAKHLLFPTMDFHSERTLVVACENAGGNRVDIKIADAEGKTVFTDKVSGSEGVRRAYQLDRLKSGQYQLIVSTRDVKNHTTAFALR